MSEQTIQFHNINGDVVRCVRVNSIMSQPQVDGSKRYFVHYTLQDGARVEAEISKTYYMLLKQQIGLRDR